MNLFDQLVSEALINMQDLAPLRVVVEKELLHHDILRVLSSSGLLSQLCFIGGTCLRTCYGSSRLSEDLDFTGGASFNKDMLSSMADLLVQSLNTKYGLVVEVGEPVKEESNVDTWKLKIQTRPGRKDLPAQRINMDVCAIPSYQSQPMMLQNPYGIEMGTSGLILLAQSREEIFADKLLAFALRPNRIKNRDLWDIAWLHQQRIKPALELIDQKLKDHHVTEPAYLTLFKKRCNALTTDPSLVLEFRKEMSRFLPSNIVKETIQSESFWLYLITLINDYASHLAEALQQPKSKNGFLM